MDSNGETSGMAWELQLCPQSSAFRGLGELWRTFEAPMPCQEDFSFGVHCSPLWPLKKAFAPKGRARRGDAGKGSVAILPQAILPQGWRKGVGCPSLPAFAGTPYRWQPFCSTPWRSLALVRGRTGAPGRQKKGPALSLGRPCWSGVSSCLLRLRAPGVHAPGRAACSPPTCWPG